MTLMLPEKIIAMTLPIIVIADNVNLIFLKL